MALPFAAGAARLLYSMTRGALRQTKHLSPFKRNKAKMFKKGTAKIEKGPTYLGGKQLRPWASSAVKGAKKVGIPARRIRQGLYGYQRGYKHLKKHKKLYGAGVTGAAAWDILDSD